MKKNIITTFLTFLSVFGLTQTNLVDSVNNKNFMLTNAGTTLRYTLNVPKLSAYYQPSPYVGVNLHLNRSFYEGYETEMKNAFLALFVSGLAFTTASLLEGNSQYGTWVSTPQPNNPYHMTYVTKPFWQQTPRQVMFCIGIGFTITGGVGAFILHKKGT